MMSVQRTENICSVTGHQNLDSGVWAYVGKPTDEQRFNMSRHLHDPPPPPPPPPPPHTHTHTETHTTHTFYLQCNYPGPHPVVAGGRAGCSMSSVEGSSSTCESAVVPLNDRSTSLPSPSCSTHMSQCLSANTQNINLERLTHSLFSGVTFSPNSNPVFNINFGSR